MTDHMYEGMTIEQVMEELNEIDARRDFLITARDRLILDMHTDGMSLRDIAPKVNLSAVGVNKAKGRAAIELVKAARLAGL